MRRFQWLVILSAVAGCMTSSASAGGVETVEIAKVQVVKAVSGLVRDANGTAISGATVAEVSADHKQVIRSVRTDTDGKFALPSEPGKKIYNLMIWSDGFNPLLIRVRTSRWTKRLLDLRLYVST